MTTTATPRPVRATATAEYATGTVRINARGFAFIELQTPTPVLDAVFVPPALTARLVHDDTAHVTYTLEPGGRATATAVRTTHRRRTHIFGTVTAGPGGTRQLRPDPHLATTPMPLRGQAAAGSAAWCRLEGNTAVLVEDLGDALSSHALRRRVLARHDLPWTDPDLRAQPGPALARTDFSGHATFTIDAATSRDLDDALSATGPEPDGAITLHVHIADVAAHIAHDSALDLAARAAATSVYLPGWNRPMLPRELSEDALSLLPGQERDTLTVSLRVAADGSTGPATVQATRIRSRQRLTYDQVDAVLAGAHDPLLLPEVADQLGLVARAADALGKARSCRPAPPRPAHRGQEVTDVGGRPGATPAPQDTASHQLIERCMVAANEAVAAWLAARHLPGIYRTHERPQAQVRTQLAALAGIPATPDLDPVGDVELDRLVCAARRTTPEATIADVVLAAMPRATYQERPGLHFGLGSAGYLHFTSPIRRYADLAVHRVIHAHLAGTDLPDLDWAALAQHLSEASGLAARAEAQTRAAMWATLLPDGQRHHGRITGVAAKSLTIVLDEVGVMGHVRLPSRLPGPYTLAGNGIAVTGSDGTGHRIGERVQVAVRRADPESGQLELRLLGARSPRGAARSRSEIPAMVTDRSGITRPAAPRRRRRI